MQNRHKNNIFIVFALVLGCTMPTINDVWAWCTGAEEYASGSNCAQCSSTNAPWRSSCGYGDFSCEYGHQRYTVYWHQDRCSGNNPYPWKYGYGCHACRNGEYAIYDKFDIEYGFYYATYPQVGANASDVEKYTPNNLLGCGTCPSDLAAAHMTQCGVIAGTGSGSSYYSYEYLAECGPTSGGYSPIEHYWATEFDFRSNAICEDGYNLILSSDTVGSRTIYQYQCLCQSREMPSGLDSTQQLEFKRNYYVYPDAAGKCRTCGTKGEQRGTWWDWSAQCVNSTLECPANTYRIKDFYNDYHCAYCPPIKNAKTLGLSNSSSALITTNSISAYGSWSSASQCTIITQEREDSETHCKYIDTIRPSSVCKETAERYLDIADTGPDPNGGNLSYYYILESQGCDYEVTKRVFTYVPVGYGVKKQGTANATCSRCSSTQYNSGGTATLENPNGTSGNITCMEAPKNAIISNDGGSWTCPTTNFLLSDTSACLPCPLYNFNPMNTTSDILTSGLYGTQGTPSSVQTNQCLFSGQTLTDITGTYSSGSCSYDQGSSREFTVKIATLNDTDSCQNAQSKFIALKDYICNNKVHCSSTACQGCVYGTDRLLWLEYYNGRQTFCQNESTSGQYCFYSFDSLYDAQKFVEVVVSVMGKGCYAEVSVH